jgi:hypothetical protein
VVGDPAEDLPAELVQIAVLGNQFHIHGAASKTNPISKVLAKRPDGFIGLWLFAIRPANPVVK